MKKYFVAASLLAIAAGVPITAQAGDVSVSTSVDYVTDYVFRGVSLADSAIQPGVEMAIGNFSAGAWFSTGIGDTSALAGDEVDLYMGYSMGLSETVSLDLGAVYYHYPQGGSLFETNGGGAGTYEISAGVSFDTVLSPSATVYYDLTLEALTLEGGIGHSMAMSDKTSLDLGLSAGLVDGDGFSYEYAGASASIGYAFTDSVSAYIAGNLALSSDDTLNYKKILMNDPKNSLVFFGAGIAAGF